MGRKKRQLSGRALLRADIEEAQTRTTNNRLAAEYLGVTYETYMRYAKTYGLWKTTYTHRRTTTLNGGAPLSVRLKDIFEGKHPRYDRERLKYRLILNNLLPECCAICGFEGHRKFDKRSPLVITFKDGNSRNMKLSNMEFMCYNCIFMHSRAKLAQSPPKVRWMLDHCDDEDTRPRTLVATMEAVKNTMDRERLEVPPDDPEYMEYDDIITATKIEGISEKEFAKLRDEIMSSILRDEYEETDDVESNDDNPEDDVYSPR